MTLWTRNNDSKAIDGPTDKIASEERASRQDDVSCIECMKNRATSEMIPEVSKGTIRTIARKVSSNENKGKTAVV